MLSATIITKNEENNIARCLNSIKDLVDEIVIVDSFSTDRTLEICKSFDKVKIYQQEWLGFGRQKQRSVDLASFSYILSLDADEELSLGLVNEINDYMKSPSSKKAVFFNRLNNYCGKWIYHCGWSPDWQLRLFHRDYCRWSEDLVHEKILFEKKVKNIYFKSYLNHYSINSINHHIEVINKYSTLGAMKIVSESKSVNIFSPFVHGSFRFVKMYFFRFGFLDGKYGLIICSLSAWAVFLRYIKAWGFYKNIWFDFSK